MKGPQYAYLHKNGKIIFKTAFVVESDPEGPEGYFASDFVLMWWKISSKTDYRLMLQELNKWYSDVDDTDQLNTTITMLSNVIKTSDNESFEF
jgi:hypothetical protein